MKRAIFFIALTFTAINVKVSEYYEDTDPKTGKQESQIEFARKTLPLIQACQEAEEIFLEIRKIATKVTDEKRNALKKLQNDITNKKIRQKLKQIKKTLRQETRSIASEIQQEKALVQFLTLASETAISAIDQMTSFLRTLLKTLRKWHHVIYEVRYEEKETAIQRQKNWEAGTKDFSAFALKQTISELLRKQVETFNLIETLYQRVVGLDTAKIEKDVRMLKAMEYR